MEGTTIRKARRADVEAVHRVLTAAFQGLRGRGYSERALEAAILSPQEIGRRVDEGAHVLVAEVDGQIVGTATGLEEHEALHVCSVAVHPDWQGQGIARRLMKALEEIARQRGCHKLWLQTAWAMTEAITLYERAGYRQEGYQPRQFYGEDFLVFGKVLTSAAEPVPSGPGIQGAILIFPGVEELDFVGVYEVLTKAHAVAAEGTLTIEQPMEVTLLAREQRVVCANGMVVQPHRRYAGLAGFDFVVVPGGRGVQALQNDDALLTDLSQFHKAGGLLCSVCTGALVLAWAGVLEGRRATTHHAHRERLAPYCQVVDQRVVADGNVITAAGVSASLDLGLALLDRFYDREVARQVAQRIEYR
ncbi:MAG TPA: GNAT family N-acetyltransferase [Thermoflexia bacterium]|nr:GNAT family N-acetyltransferase [Thermoflexia bacterium]